MKSVKNVIISLAMVAILLVGGAFAYLTDSDTATNILTVGNVEIELTEPSFDGNAAKDLYAGEVVAKDPTVKNTGTNDAYVYLMVTVPKADVVVTDAEGNKQASKVQPLFTYAINSGWTLIKSDEADTSASRYVYAYDTRVASNASTNALFNNVTLANVIEGQISSNEELKVVIDAYAIQADFTTAKTPAEAWAACVNQNEIVL